MSVVFLFQRISLALLVLSPFGSGLPRCDSLRGPVPRCDSLRGPGLSEPLDVSVFLAQDGDLVLEEHGVEPHL